ncbi:antibiotic biosynthesis monooxygenase family protein [Streptomyces lutosisoli]|uniref:Antibiotic biosynthesis monooxygenase family protein n=1 Tax=Streptomyces lutosisoli TaxID=2665721 RepID=A0ABW2VKG5_9ACTN
MSTISVENGYLSLFNIFHTDGPEIQQRLFDRWRSLPPGNTDPGLVAGNFHRSFDGRSVINYGQWESQDQYDAFLRKPASQNNKNEALTYARAESLRSEVVYASNPVPELSLDKPRFTVVAVVKTPPESHLQVLKTMSREDPELADTPGYVSHAVHRELNGPHVVKYAQWEDEESFRSFAKQPAATPPFGAEVTADLYFCSLEYIRSR